MAEEQIRKVVGKEVFFNSQPFRTVPHEPGTELRAFAFSSLDMHFKSPTERRRLGNIWVEKTDENDSTVHFKPDDTDDGDQIHTYRNRHITDAFLMYGVCTPEERIKPIGERQYIGIGLLRYDDDEPEVQTEVAKQSAGVENVEPQSVDKVQHLLSDLSRKL